MTARSLIIAALHELGVLGAVAELEPEDGELGLLMLQGMVDVFQGDRLLLHTVTRTVYTLTANQQTRTVGAAGQFVGPRPLWVEHVGVVAVGGTTESEVVPYHSRKEWLAEASKTLTDTVPRRYLYEPTSALLGTFTFWPIPTTAASLAVSAPTALTTPLTLNTVLAFAPGGYEEAWRLNLALRLARPFRTVPAPDLKEDARMALGIIKRLNDEGPPLSRSDPAVVGQGGYDIRSNGYR